MKIFKLIFINVLLFLLLFEILLRLFWSSPYVSFDKNVYFHKPFDNYKFTNIDQLYNYNKDIFLRTGKYGNIISNKEINIEKDKTYALALGGSSTESALVPEGLRWPDNLEIPTFNFGKSRLNSSHTVENLKYIFTNYNLNPKYVFVMDGVNNLANFISYGEDGLSYSDYSSHKNIYKYIRKNYYTFALIIDLVKKNNYFIFYKKLIEKKNEMKIIKNDTLDEFIKLNKKKMFNILKLKFTKMKKISANNKFRLIILTQPHSYDINYKPYKYDLRSRPIINDKILTIKQSEKITNFYNNLTIDVAKSIDLEFIDINQCFRKVNTSKLFYDAIHLTLEGSKFFAQCLNKNLKKLNN